jgi:hypothetical protein
VIVSLGISGLGRRAREKGQGKTECHAVAENKTLSLIAPAFIKSLVLSFFHGGYVSEFSVCELASRASYRKAFCCNGGIAHEKL